MMRREFIARFCLGLTGSILAWTIDCADEVTLSRKGAKSQTRAGKLRSTRTKVRTRVGRAHKRPADLEQLETYKRELAHAREQLAEAFGTADCHRRRAQDHQPLNL